RSRPAPGARPGHPAPAGGVRDQAGPGLAARLLRAVAAREEPGAAPLALWLGTDAGSVARQVGGSPSERDHRMRPVVDVEHVSAGLALDEVRALFGEYASSLAVDLSFQDFSAELRDLPGQYAPPGGALLLGRVDGVTAGCVGVRPWQDG